MSVTEIVSKINLSEILLVRTVREIFVLHIASLWKSREELSHILAKWRVLLGIAQKPVVVPVNRSLCFVVEIQTRLKLLRNLCNCFSVCFHFRGWWWSHDDTEFSCFTVLLLTSSGCFAVSVLRHFNYKWFAPPRKSRAVIARMWQVLVGSKEDRSCPTSGRVTLYWLLGLRPSFLALHHPPSW